jgi:hypothetical protein
VFFDFYKVFGVQELPLSNTYNQSNSHYKQQVGYSFWVMKFYRS